jgi:HlyD family secretion protein
MNTLIKDGSVFHRIRDFFAKHKKYGGVARWGVVILFILISSVSIFRYFLPRSIVPGGFVTGIADTGSVLRTVEAEGLVVPENEVILRAYSGGVIKKIINSPGSHIREGDIILQMETDPIQKEIENAQDQLDVMKNNLSKNRLNAKSTKVDLDYNIEIKKLNLTSLKSDLADQEQLLEVGGISPAKVEKTRQEIVIAQMELETTQEKNLIRLKQLDAEEEGLLLQITMKEKEIEDLKETLQKTMIRTPSAGIVLNIYGKEGDKVNSGEMLAQISNMTTFKINASTTENFAEVVKTGGDVIAKVNKDRLEGKIGRVLPVIENNKANFEVFLKESGHPDLIPNMKVNMNITVDRRDSVLRVPNGPAFNDSEKQFVFVVESGRAVRRQIVTGLRGTDFIEIVSGLKAGEVVITSDVSAFRHFKSVSIEN